LIPDTEYPVLKKTKETPRRNDGCLVAKVTATGYDSKVHREKR